MELEKKEKTERKKVKKLSVRKRLARTITIPEETQLAATRKLKKETQQTKYRHTKRWIRLPRCRSV